MATVSRHGKGWRAQIRRRGMKALSATFPLKGQAMAWAAQREAEIVGGRLGILPQHTLDEALDKFEREVSAARAGRRWERTRLAALRRSTMARRPVASITATDIAEWRDAQLLRVSGATVRRVMGLLGAVFDVALREWRWIDRNPMREVRKPPSAPSRARGLAQAEIDGVVAALGAAPAKRQVALAFLLAIETAMRTGEILALRWVHVHPSHVHLPKSKNGDARDVPLSMAARALLEERRGKDPERVFTIDSAMKDALFRAARKDAGLSGFTFHDSRSEAISRLAKKLDVLELARMVGHRDLKSLLVYYHASPQDLAAKLG